MRLALTLKSETAGCQQMNTNTALFTNPWFILTEGPYTPEIFSTSLRSCLHNTVPKGRRKRAMQKVTNKPCFTANTVMRMAKLQTCRHFYINSFKKDNFVNQMGGHQSKRTEIQELKINKKIGKISGDTNDTQYMKLKHNLSTVI